MERLDDDAVERVLRSTIIEHGTADLSDRLGSHVIAPAPPSAFMPPTAAIAGRVLLLRRERPADGVRPPSSFRVLRQAIKPGDVVLVRADRSIGAAFGSNVVLQAAACRAQAIVTDGAWRDSTRIATVGIPSGANGAAPTRPAGCPMVVVDHEELFGLSWNTGDWFLRDADGVLRLDDDLAQQTATELAAGASGELASLLEPGES
jgi:regulator of RNase E activity RraA